MANLSQLRVEGPDDSHAIRHLLWRHGIDYDQKPCPKWFPSIEEAGGKDALLENVERNVRASSGRSVGFVLDANSSLQNRWNAMASRLRKLGLEMPDVIPPGGFVGESATYRARVGVWLMPDNEQDGALEHFLETLVAESDPLIEHARGATTRARELGARSATTPKGRPCFMHGWRGRKLPVCRTDPPSGRGTFATTVRWPGVSWRGFAGCSMRMKRNAIVRLAKPMAAVDDRPAIHDNTCIKP